MSVKSLLSESWHFKAFISKAPKNFFSPTANLIADVFAVILSRAFSNFQKLEIDLLNESETLENYHIEFAILAKYMQILSADL